MNMIARIRLVVPVVLVLAMLVLPSTASALATRTWVSGIGDDVNPCSRTAPCKTLAMAITRTAPGGEINAVDSAGFGVVTITKSITIDLRSVEGGILNAGVSGFVVNGSGIDVVLRGVHVHAGGAAEPLPPLPACQFSANSQGVRILNARSVRIEDSSISSQAVAGVNIVPSAAAIDVSLDRVDIHNSCGTGINAAPTGTGRTNLHVDDTSIVSTATALSVGANAAASIAGSTLFGNGTGLNAHDGGTIAGLGNNVLVGNAVPGTFTSNVDALTCPPPTVVTNTVQVPTPAPLVAVFAMPSQTTKIGRTTTARYAATANATAKLEVRRGTTLVATVNGTAHKGSNAISWNGKSGARAAAPGTYVATLRLTGGGQSTTAKLTIVVTR
jgi:hypothetical protein